jgi:glycosyltransferase involved in cell wall biosynthesis
VTSAQQTARLAGVTVAHVGHFDACYSRNRILRKALCRAGATVLTTTDPRPFLRRAARLVHDTRAARPDVVLIGFPGHADVVPALLAGVGRRMPIILDAFVSLYETAVEDRRRAAAGSVGAARYAIEDRVSCRLADRVLVDTDAHRRHFTERIGVPTQKLQRIWVGADDEIMRPGAVPDPSSFRVFAYGSFIPLHGFEYVVRAAHVLEQRRQAVEIEIVGAGQTEAEARRLARDLGVSSVRFLGRRRYEELPALISRAHVCLGIFGTSGKARRVIPNKVFDALAVGRPVITGDTPAAREALTHGVDGWLCPVGDPEALADAIVMLRDDVVLRERLAARGQELFGRRFSIDAIARDVTAVFEDALAIRHDLVR